MSLYPCIGCGHRVRGSLSTLYPALLNGATRLSNRMRLCEAHLAERLEGDCPKLVEIYEDTEQELSPACGNCGQAAFELSSFESFFVTAFPKGEERADYFAYVCPPCAVVVAAAWGLRP